MIDGSYIIIFSLYLLSQFWMKFILELQWKSVLLI